MTRRSLALQAIILTAVASGCSDGVTTHVEENRLVMSLPDLDGDAVSLSDARFQNKVLVVTLWGSWCPPCHELMPELARLDNAYRADGLEIIGANFEMVYPDEPEAMRTFQEELAAHYGIEFQMLFGGGTADVDRAFPTLREFQGFPTTVLIGRDGEVRHVLVGFLTEDAPGLETQVTELLAE